MIRFISDDDIEKVHEKTLHLLEMVGCQFQHEVVLKKLEKAGAGVDMQSHVVHFPRNLVEECIKLVPQEYILAGRESKNDIQFPLGENEFITRTNTGAPHYVEPRTYKHRDIITLSQCNDWIRLCDAMDQVDYVACPFIGDAPLNTAGLYALRSQFHNSGKHFWIQPYHEDTIPYIFEILCTVTGSKKELKKRPVAHPTVGAISPLQYKYMDTEMLKCAGDYGIPVTIYTLPSMGGTAPLTMAGITLLTNAELLAGNVVVQVCNPGTPVHFLGHKFKIDMRTGSAGHSFIEPQLAAAANAELSIYKYGIPFHSYGSGSDSMVPDGQSQIERTFQGLLFGLGHGKVFGGLGQLETVNAICPTQLVIDNDIIARIRMARRTISWDDDQMAADVIAEVGIGGEYMTHEHTARHCRDAVEARTFNKQSRSDWMQSGGKGGILDNAEDILDVIIKNHKVSPLPEDIAKEIDNIIKSADEKLN